MANNKWGYQAEPRYKSYSWTKLLLDGKSRVTEFDNPNLGPDEQLMVMQLPETKDAVKVSGDFLREVHEHVLAKIKLEITEKIYESTPVEYWITVPASKSHLVQETRPLVLSLLIQIYSLVSRCKGCKRTCCEVCRHLYTCNG